MTRSGLGVDESGGPVIDPTENVIALTEAANKRQDDLRQLNNERIDARIETLAEKVEGLEKRLILRAEHQKEIRQLETERVNAIRQVDVLAGNTAAERALVAIQTLASQTTAERETLRNLVTTSATTLAAQNAQDLARINEAISALQKSSYEGAGKQAVADPMIANMMLEQKRTNEILAEKLGGSKGMDKMWGYAVAAIGLLYILLKLAGKM